MDTEIAKGMRGKESGVVCLDALIGEIGRGRDGKIRRTGKVRGGKIRDGDGNEIKDRGKEG
jgi:hypothetical protein